MSDQPGGGRARGRARGRSRGQTTDGAQVRRPGEEPPQAAAAAQPPAPAPVHPTQVQGGGRKNHRGVPRSDVPRAAEVESVARGIAAVSIPGGGDEYGESRGRGASRRAEDYGVDNTRPAHIQDKKGTTGSTCQIMANYFELLSKPQWAIQQYHVEFAPNVESSRIRRGLIGTQREALGSCYLFDGMSDLKTVMKFETEIKELFSKRKTDDETIRITLKWVAELAPSHPELGRLFNTQMRRNLQHLKFQLLGRYYYDENAISEVPQHNLQIWQGVITSIRQHEDRLMMCVDTVHKVVRKETALDVIRNMAQRNPNTVQDEASKELVSQIVMTKYNNRTYRIEDIVWDLNPLKSFETRDGGSITYVQYYKKQYDIDIRDQRQPLMLCTSKEKELRGGQSQAKKIYLVPELCCMTGLTDQMRSNFRTMSDLATQTKLDPARRVENLERFIERVNQNPAVNQEMTAWGLKFANRPVCFQARVAVPEAIVQGPAKYHYDQRTADFSKEMRGKSMHVARNLDDWLVICPKADQPKCTDFLNSLSRVCPPMGMQYRNPRVVYIDYDRVNNYLQSLRENRTQHTSIVLFIVPNNKKDRYDALKKNTCLDSPIPSQVVVGRTISKKPMLMSVATKIGIQLNCKLGGEPWAVEIPFKAGVMICGFDTYHDSTRKGKSAGGFVASMNQSFTRWFSNVSFHSSGGWQELSNNLKTHLTEALRRYQHYNRCLPNFIIFYRDGVGDGQIRYVKEWEVSQLENTILQIIEHGSSLAEMKTRYAFIVVNKKINTRFFAQAGPNRYSNPTPGTIVDSVVTRYDRYDFFLVSQSVRQGTVGPTMYNVIADRSGLKPEHMQRLSYKLTHLYYNWPGTIRVPAPCQYAHKLAFLTGQTLHREPAEELQDTLFYL